MATTRTIDIKTAVSFMQQAAYGTKLPNTALTVFLPFNGEDFMEVTPVKTDDADKQKGHEFAEGEQQAQTISTACKRSFDCHTAGFAWVAAMACGSLVTTVLEPDTAYKHTIKSMNPKTAGRQLPVVSIVEEKGNEKTLYRDMLIPGFQLQGQLEQQPSLSFDMIGSGYHEPSTLELPTDPLPVSFLKTGKVLFKYNNTDLSARLNSFDFSWKWEVNEKGGYHYGSPFLTITDNGETVEYQCRGRLKAKKRTVELKFKILKEDSVIKIDDLLNRTRAIELTCTGGKITETISHQAKLIIPRASFQTVKEAADDGEMIYDCAVLCKYDSTCGGPFALEIINDIPEYLGIPS